MSEENKKGNEADRPMYKEFPVRHKEDDLTWRSYQFILEDLTQEQMDEVAILFADQDILDAAEGKVIDNSLGAIMGMNVTFAKKSLYPKVCAKILRDENGNEKDFEFFKKCRGKDTQAVCDFFFNGEGASMFSGVSALMVSSVLRKLQEINASL